MYYGESNLGAVENGQLGFPPLAIAAGVLPLATGILQAFQKKKKPKESKGPSPAEIAAMQAQAEAERKAAQMKTILLVGGGLLVLGLGAFLIFRKK